ncbi:hypothetical protein CANTEDRAFT_113932 [Yamadazyma tenuis ATCC 10573]|uniref:Peptidase M20 dimerisation domain-containing protein n=1 Tax=Candida tenuis (strain ATCC 10573 / BCRC 21748 / CBS 615 / JCM 9827 / NBRC 10315 / NRRL Y-1498 / VKM Y-70) TaxID=590646 RepID=G3B3Z6_CANTC|nr:uncharacterized protein CANTEDRAFT_113932 [Yamadazyma tenuis ATCC 10573]EGV64290.1 hypothetical protein CANTEDRAFT_113932 [Yamadazyma tenuis ATCC 10573]
MRGLSSSDVKSKKSLIYPIAIAGIVGLSLLSGKDNLSTDGLCPILPIKAPVSFLKDNSTVLSILHDKEFREKSAEKLAKAVQVDTVVFDSPPEPDENPEYWTKFLKFHQYLRDTFPTVHSTLKLDKVNTYGLVFTWEGTNPDLKPIMLTAHQDVVPVQQDSLGKWTHPPFEGYYDGEYLFGRGSCDCKNVLTAIMESLELLIAQDFKPERTVIAAFGMDEESGGLVGARHIGEFLEERYGVDGIYAIIDEGFPFSLEPQSGVFMATPLVSEKGMATIKSQLQTPGGHSSMPPDHTSIGMISELVYLLENNPFEPLLTSKNPTLNMLQCVATHFGDKLPPSYREAILKADYDTKSNQIVVDALQKDVATRYFIRTSQAVDIIKGGEKANALPEAVTLTVNHRIALESSIKEIVDRFMKYAKIVAVKYNLGLNLEGTPVIDSEGKFGILDVTLDGSKLEPVEPSPSDDTVWEYLAGVSRHLMHDLIKPDLEYDFVVTPMVMQANTDTARYHHLTKSIFRYSPSLGQMINFHSIDERLEFDAHLHLIAFFFEYLQTIDTPDAENQKL